jgi:hypothetical protein
MTADPVLLWPGDTRGPVRHETWQLDLARARGMATLLRDYEAATEEASQLLANCIEVLLSELSAYRQARLEEASRAR